MNTESSEKKALLQRRSALQSRLEAIRKDVGRGFDKDSSERAIELENADVLDEIARVAQEELAQIEEKLAQLR